METKTQKVATGYFHILLLLRREEGDWTAMARSLCLIRLITFFTIAMLIGGGLMQLTLLNRIDSKSSGGLIQLKFLNRVESKASVDIPQVKIDGEAAILRQGLIKAEVISWSPRIFVFRNFLSVEECDHLRTLAEPHLVISSVVNAKTGKSVNSNHRTSTGMFLDSKDRKHPIIQRIETRIAVFSQVPKENGEPIQVLRYKEKQFYKLHHDYFGDRFNIEKRGHQRVATMLMYLSDNVEGGETYFPMAGGGKCSCGGKTVEGMSVKPIKGDAVLFWSMTFNGSVDPKSFHAGCEVLGGDKWSATKWMRQNDLGLGF